MTGRAESKGEKATATGVIVNGHDAMLDHRRDRHTHALIRG